MDIMNNDVRKDEAVLEAILNWLFLSKLSSHNNLPKS